MLIELETIEQFPGSPCLAHVRTPLGRVVVRWCGDPGAEPGTYRVEWTVDVDVAWGRNTHAATRPGPEIRRTPHGVVLRGRLHHDEAGPVMDVGGAMILLDLASPLPEGVAGTWVELHAEPESITVYPYEL
ncbi:hypothetical protein HRW16_04300 [Streptomyces lunaelactis]|uniref:hypothetical protein n=1 Tax=Streptomyces lunaelactis TaxID=1535768 RepID=UPI0015850279|nr:hypothetical protein [Streptomyces lunaelactis]NUK33815.1 hypothetical protein [Streptomyces lunaelactis]NUK41429.1 hypothetical protein [Streptomyces lunaelactis]NUK91094.1 hypothetical protein [Streptomyces lunaelactis]NUL29689.1 hypothetical protein [Streptomyces lunaelactis]